MRLQFFLSLKNTATNTNPNHTIAFYTQNGPKFFFSGGVAPEPLGGLFMSAPAWPYRPKPPLHRLNLRKYLIKNHATLFGSGRVVKPNQTKLGSTKPNKSPIWRLVQSPTSTTIPHPYNSSSCPQVRRPTETTHSFSFSMVTPLVNMSAGFLNPQIFSTITNLSSTR